MWLRLLANPSHRRDLIDLWQQLSAGLRQFLKGWGANLGKENIQVKQTLIANIQALGVTVDSSGLDDEGWMLRYHLEDRLVNIYAQEEEYWR